MIFNVGAGGASKAEQVKYDNSTSGLNSDNVQGAVDELQESVSDLNDSLEEINDSLEGLNTLVTIDNTTDLNNLYDNVDSDIVKTKYYIIRGAQAPINAPDKGAYNSIITVIRTPPHQVQSYFSYNLDKKWERIGSTTGGWREWKEIF